MDFPYQTQKRRDKPQTPFEVIRHYLMFNIFVDKRGFVSQIETPETFEMRVSYVFPYGIISHWVTFPHSICQMELPEVREMMENRIEGIQKTLLVKMRLVKAGVLDAQNRW